MTKEQKLDIMKNRLGKLENSPKNIKSHGVLRKVTRQVRNLEKSLV